MEKVYGKIEFINSWTQFNGFCYIPNMIITIDFVNFIYLQFHDATLCSKQLNSKYLIRMDYCQLLEICRRICDELTSQFDFLFNGFENYESLKMKVRVMRV